MSGNAISLRSLARRSPGRRRWLHLAACLTATLLSLAATSVSHAQTEAASALVRRLAPQAAEYFVFEAIPQEQGQDVFELESRDGKIVVRGSNGVAMASGWNWYLKYYGHCHVSLWGDQLKLPDPLPPVPEKVRQVSPFKYRYYLNFCTFSYSLPWYDWPQWERLIDWMALHGINMPLSVTGQEAIWEKVFHDLGLNDQQLAEFFTGPGYLPFGWMGCIDAWGGPLPKSWIQSHLELEKKILARERELGMTPVLQGFTGHVPAGLAEVFPGTKLEKLDWCRFPSTYFLDPQNPLFVRIGKMFVEEQTRQFGSDHLYASDTFIEMPPPRNDPDFLAAMGRSVYEAMRAGDPQAVWVMQGWIFVHKPDFWKPPQARALLGAVPDERMILLDLACEDKPVWNKTEAFYGKPWIWNIIQDYGDVTSLHGGLPQIAEHLHEAFTSPQRGRLEGIGLVNEGLGNNPVVNDFIGEMAWRSEVPTLAGWVHDHIQGRYGRCPAAAEDAWRRLLETAYNMPARTDSKIIQRPKLLPSDRSKPRIPPYDPAQLALAWRDLLSCADELGAVDTYRFDLVHVGRQVLADLARPIYFEAMVAYEQKDRAALADASGRYLQLIRDLDTLVATRQELLLGKWIADAKRWGTTAEERRLYEWNARNILTLWGDRDSMLRDYANKHWSGLLVGFYLPRWQKFFAQLDAALVEGKPLDADAYENMIRGWEAEWSQGTESYPATPQGDSLEVSRRLWEKYSRYFAEK